MIKTWDQRMPARLPESANASVSITLDCMIAEIDELRAENAALLAANRDSMDHYNELRLELANERDEVELKTACINGMRAAANSLAGERDALRAELEKIKQQEPYCFAVVEPATKHCKYPEVVFTAQWPEACHEHINDAIAEHGCGSKWVVRKLYLAPGAQPVPDGMVLVPIEPTEKMLKAMALAWQQSCTDGNECYEEYKAMLEEAKP